MPSSLAPCKIALLDFNLQQYRAQMGVQVLINDPEQLESIRQKYAFNIS
jgi:T-complex protein 1 subunit alpha